MNIWTQLILAALAVEKVTTAQQPTTSSLDWRNINNFFSNVRIF